MKRFSLVDCNNFFVSCERIFDPKLIRKPVVILSSNDACIIARSEEAKVLGIPMGAPLFKYENIIKKYNIKVLSSNFTLYADISSRVMQTLYQYSTDLEIYSIDEAFLFMPDFINKDFNNSNDLYYKLYAEHIRKKIKQKTGIPVSIGIGPTKTLAKIANKLAKKSLSGVFDITNHEKIDSILANFSSKDIWGIGRRHFKKLEAKNILSAKDLKYYDDKWIKKNLTVCGLKTVYELRGISCLELNQDYEDKQSITVSRLFGRNIVDIKELKEAVCTYTITGAKKARSQKSIVSSITVFLMYKKYHDSQKFIKSSTYNFTIATSYTPDLMKAASECVEKIFKQGLIYKKAGIILNDLYPADFLQLNTYNSLSNIQKQSKIMSIIDKINNKNGRNLVTFAAAGIHKPWKMKQLRKSNCFTTNWKEILTIKI